MHTPRRAGIPHLAIQEFLGVAKQQARLVSVFRKERPQQTAAGSTERVLTL